MWSLLLPSARQAAKARAAIRAHFVHEGVDEEHAAVVALAASELLGAVEEAGVVDPVTVTVQRFPRLTSVRVKGAPTAHFGDEPIGLRERVLEGVSLAYGERRNVDGTIDLWAEIPA